MIDDGKMAKCEYRLNEKISKFKEDEKGLLYSSELILSLIILLFLIGIIANMTDIMNEKILSEEEESALEEISIESGDYLLSNPGNPDDWEDDEGLERGIVSKKIIPGLAIKDKSAENGFFKDESSKSESVMINSISYQKLIALKNNYDELINRNLFNDTLKSSIIINPLNSNLEDLEMGDDLEGYDNVMVVKRRVQCDYYSDFVFYRFNDFELYGKDYVKREICNHDTNPSLQNHSNDGRSFWLCKSFRIYKSLLKSHDYYLLSPSSIRHSNSYYIIESLNRTRDDMERLDDEVIELNSFFEEDMENSSNEIYSIHFKVPKEDVDDFKTVLVAIPKNMTEDILSNNQLRYDYFNGQEVDFVLKTAYR